MEVSQEQLLEYQNKIKQQNILIIQIQDRNKQLSVKLDELLEENSTLEDKFENYQSNRHNDQETRTNLILSQKIEYLQNELRSLNQIKQEKEEDYQQVINELGMLKFYLIKNIIFRPE